VSRILINVLAWLVLQNGTSLPGFMPIDEIGFNQPVLCQFDIPVHRIRTVEFPSINRRERLRGVMMIIQLPILADERAGHASESTIPAKRMADCPVTALVKCIPGMASEGFSWISDSTIDLVARTQDLGFRSAVSLVHPPRGHFQSVSRRQTLGISWLAGKFDMDRMVKRVLSMTSRLSHHPVSTDDGYWSYYRDCDRWGAVLKRMGSSARLSPVQVGSIRGMGRRVADQIGMAVRVIVPGSILVDVLRTRGNDYLEAVAPVIGWWQEVVFEGVKTSVSGAIQTLKSWR